MRAWKKCCGFYQAWGTYKMPLLLFPLLSLADRLVHFRENWYGFRG